VTELRLLKDVGQAGDLVFFGVDRDLCRRFGPPGSGAASFLRDRTRVMLPWTQTCGEPCHDVGVLGAGGEPPETLVQNIFLIAEYATSLGMRPAMVGCDHTASLPCLRGLQKARGGELHYLYLDAHLDLGLHSPSGDLHNGNFVNTLRGAPGIRSITNLGARCWSTFAPEYQALGDLRFLPGDQAPWAPERLDDFLAPLKGQAVYVSLDADVLDPASVPGLLNCPEPFGLTLQGLLECCQWIARHCEVVGGDLCELCPHEPSLGLEQGIMRCFHALFSRPRPTLETPIPPLGDNPGLS